MQRLDVIRLQIENFENLREMALKTDETELITYVDRELITLYKSLLTIEMDEDINRKLRILELLNDSSL